jgi:flagellar biosynthesis/type III secretory pathway protein FliH
LKVIINPQDIKIAEKTESIWKPILSSLKSIELVIDNSIEQGCCLLESEKGSSIDMRLNTIWGHIEETVRRIYSN